MLMRAARSMTAIARHATPLVARLIFGGVYLLVGVLKSPLEADQTAVICPGVLLALATILLFYMLSPKRFEVVARDDEARSDEPLLEIPLTADGEAPQARQRRNKLWKKIDWLGPRQGRKVALLEDDAVVAFVPRDDET